MSWGVVNQSAGHVGWFARGADQVQISVIRPDELEPSDIAAWHTMQRSTGPLGNPFLSPEFAIAASRVRPAARVAILNDGPSLLGFFPFERHQLGVGTPIAAELTLCQGLIHAPGAEWDARELLRACRISVWQFDHLVAGQRPFEVYRTAMLPSPTIDLADGFDSYFKKLRAASPGFAASWRAGHGICSAKSVRSASRRTHRTRRPCGC